MNEEITHAHNLMMAQALSLSFQFASMVKNNVSSKDTMEMMLPEIESFNSLHKNYKTLVSAKLAKEYNDAK